MCHCRVRPRHHIAALIERALQSHVRTDHGGALCMPLLLENVCLCCGGNGVCCCSLVGWLVGWLVGRSVGLLVGSLVRWFAGSLVRWFARSIIALVCCRVLLSHCLLFFVLAADTLKVQLYWPRRCGTTTPWKTLVCVYVQVLSSV